MASAEPPKKSESFFKKIWHFLWYEDSVASWVVSILLSFILIKFIIYPGMGLILGTQFPVVAVVSESMEHNEPYDAWWTKHEDLYLRYDITKEEFREFPMKSGFNRGDLIVLFGVKPENVEVGDIIVFWGGKAYPIIHRVVATHQQPNRIPYFETKGDNNLGQIIEPPRLDETNIPAYTPCNDESDGQCDIVIGRAVLRIPLLGWVKIGFVNLLNTIGIPVA